MKKGLSGLLLVFAIVFFSPEVRSQDAPDRLYSSIDVAVASFIRQKDFLFGIQAQSGTLQNIREFKHGLDTLNPGGNITIGYWLNDYTGMEVGFLGTDQNASNRTSFPGQDVFFPLIAGSIEGQQAVLFGVDSTTPPGSARVRYNQTIFDVHLDGRLKLWPRGDNDSTYLDGVLGFAFLFLGQDVRHRAAGTISTGPTAAGREAGLLQTDVDLDEKLFGGRIGLRSGYGLSNQVKVSISIIGNFYGRSSDLSAKQIGNNMRIPFAATNRDVFITLKKSASDFVPRAEANLALTYDATDNISIGAFYNFNALWNMGFSDTPTPDCTANCRTDHPLRIGGRDRVFAHIAGLRLSLRF